MPEFLSLITPEEALDMVFSHWEGPRAVEIDRTDQAFGRITAVDICATQNLPDFRRSTVDGYAVRARDTHGASEGLPAYLELVGEILMGQKPGFSLSSAQCGLIHTGGMLPNGADAVVMLEDAQALENGEIEIYRPAAAGDNLIDIGEDVREGDVIIPRGTRLRPAEIGGLLALGITEVQLIKPPLIGVISSGDEVIHPEKDLKPGQVRDINSYTLEGVITDLGAMVKGYGIIPDNREAMRDLMVRALQECDHLIVTAGSSASSRDLTAEIMNELGDPGVIVHGLQIKPGKPTIFAFAGEKLMIGLPGNPVSALVIAWVMVRPILEKILGVENPRPRPIVNAVLAVNIPSQAGREDWIPVRLEGNNSDGWKAEPIFGRSNLIFVLARADGLVRIPPAVTGLETGSIVAVQLMD